MQLFFTIFAQINLRKGQISRNNYFLNRVKSSTFHHSFKSGHQELPEREMPNTRAGGPEFLASLSGYEWCPRVNEWISATFSRVQDDVFLEICPLKQRQKEKSVPNGHCLAESGKNWEPCQFAKFYQNILR